MDRISGRFARYDAARNAGAFLLGVLSALGSKNCWTMAELSGREVHSALSLVTRATSILVQEIFDYANFDDYEFLGKSMGFGMIADGEQPMFFLPGVLTTMWGGPVRNLAAELGVELDDVRQRIEPWDTDKRIECKMCTVEPVRPRD